MDVSEEGMKATWSRLLRPCVSLQSLYVWESQALAVIVSLLAHDITTPYSMAPSLQVRAVLRYPILLYVHHSISNACSRASCVLMITTICSYTIKELNCDVRARIIVFASES